MSEPFLAEIVMFAGNFSPRGWAFCQGQTLSIAQNTALFSLLGTTFGGNGQTTFQLPNLAGRVPLGTGQGAGLSNIILGELSGHETVTLTTNNLPAHSHQAFASQASSTASRPSGQVPAGGGSYTSPTDGTTMNAGHIGNTGGNQPFDIHPPYLGINFIIAIEGIYPSRN